MKKRLALLLVLLLLVLSFLTACGQIEDGNGPDDFALVTLTDADILVALMFTIPSLNPALSLVDIVCDANGMNSLYAMDTCSRSLSDTDSGSTLPLMNGLRRGSEKDTSAWGYLLWIRWACIPHANASRLKSPRPRRAPKATPLMPPRSARSCASKRYEKILFGPPGWSSAYLSGSYVSWNTVT